MKRAWVCHYCYKLFHAFEEREEHMITIHLKEKIMDKK